MNYKILLLIGLLIVIITGIIIDSYSLEKRKESKQYKEYVKAQQDKFIDNYLENHVNNSWSGNEITPDNAGTTGNFEGPQVIFEYLKFHDKHYNTEGSQMLFFDGNSLHFDPDHPSYGLPNLIAKISPVSIYNPEDVGLASLLRISGNESKQKLICSARMVHWAMNDPAHIQIQVDTAIEHFRNNMIDYNRRFNLNNAPAKVCQLICDIRNQGRGKNDEIASAINTNGNWDRAYTNLTLINYHRYKSRIDTVKNTISGLISQGIFDNKYDSSQNEFR